MRVFLRRCVGVIVTAAIAAGLSAAAGAQGGGQGMGGMKMPMKDHMAMPKNLDTATSRMTKRKRYVATIRAESKPVEINRMHRWILTLRTADGRPVEDAAVSVDGGMPDHGHGLPTAPRVTKYLGKGRYLVDGVRFNMTGWWQLTFAIAGAEPDSVTFNLVLK